MAREYARVRVDIWIDDDIRELSPPAQHLYFVLLTSPQLSYCGVTDWRPGRIAAAAKGWSADEVSQAAVELTRRLYIVPDEDTEEVLIRSFVRHDGLMKESRVAVSMVKAFGAVASNNIRGVIVHELRRLHDEDDTLNGWKTTKGEPGQALTLLKLNALDPADLAQGLADGLGVGLAQTSESLGVGLGGVWGSVSGSTSPAPTPAPAPSTSDEVEKKDGTRKRVSQIPDPFEVTEAMRVWASANGIGLDLARETAKFADFHRAKGSTFKDWEAAWRTWMRKAVEYSGNVRALPGARPGGPRYTDEVVQPRSAFSAVVDR